MTHGIRRLALAAVALLPGLAGCLSPQMQDAGFGPRYAKNAVALPAPGTVPSELNKVTLPEYVIEPPDVLRIQVIVRETEKDPVTKKDVIDPKTGKKALTNTVRSLPLQQVDSELAVRPDGTVYLGIYGEVSVAGYTLKQAAQAIREHLAKQAFKESAGVDPDSLLLILDVTQYNSKRFYVIFDGAGLGEQVIPQPITGSETVLDAVAAVNGLPSVASKRNIWVARRTPHPDCPEQILPVDWVGITQHGLTTSNYQIMPGDRVYVKAQRLITIDNTLTRVFAPIEKLFGVTLLGASTVNQVKGRGLGFGNAGN